MKTSFESGRDTSSSKTDETDENGTRALKKLQKLDDTSLTINGVLMALQGPLPVDGSIIVATTNYLDRIIAVREALVRPGRLTPVYFGPPCHTVVDQISRFYFILFKLSHFFPLQTVKKLYYSMGNHLCT